MQFIKVLSVKTFMNVISVMHVLQFSTVITCARMKRVKGVVTLMGCTTPKTVLTFITVIEGKNEQMIIAVVNTKGGTGKTTSAVFIAHGMAQTGKTLLVDADPQQSSMSWSKLVGNDFVPSTVPLAVGDLKDRIPALAESFEHVVIDTPPGEGSKNESPITESAILSADAVIIPMGPTAMDLDRLAPTLELLASLERRHGHSPQLHVLLTRVRAGTNSSIVTRSILEDDFKLPVLKTEIPLLERYANAMGLPISFLGEYNDVISEVGGQ